MAILLHILQGLFAVMAFGLLWGFIEEKQAGLLLAAVVYGGGSYVSYAFSAWWPLFVAFIGAWVLRLIGFDPHPY